MPKTFVKDGYVVKKKRFGQSDGTREGAFELQKEITDGKTGVEEKEKEKKGKKKKKSKK